MSVRLAARLVLALAALMTLLVLLRDLRQNPVTAPYVARSEAELQVAIEAALARHRDPVALANELAEALASGNLIRAEALAAHADEQGAALPAPLLERLAAARAHDDGPLVCAMCALDPRGCSSEGRLLCRLSLELTPVGDLRAIGYAAADYAAGREVDRFDLALATVGLAATAGIVATGGATAPVKAGAAVMRTARGAGRVSEALAREIGTLGARLIRLDELPPSAILSRRAILAAVDRPALASLSNLAGDLGRVSRNMPMRDAIHLVGKVDNAEDAARLARVSKAMGARTVRSYEVLGKRRILRLSLRLSNGARRGLALGGALLAELTALAMGLAQSIGLRLARRAI